MKVFLHYEDNDDVSLHKTLKITLPKSWRAGPTSRLLKQFVESYNCGTVTNGGGSGDGPSQPYLLDQESMHLANRNTNSTSGLGGGGGGLGGGGVDNLAVGSEDEMGQLTPLPSDGIIKEVIEDRSDVYVMHGKSRTIEEIEEERRKEAERIRKELESTVSCTHFGCKNRFPKGGPYPNCRYHLKPPIFHETAKYWSCCPHKKAYDWDQFQDIPGCQVGQCSEVKEEGQRDFLGGCDVREQLSGATDKPKLRTIDDFNKSELAGGSEAAPVLDRLRGVMAELGVETELFDQVVDGMKKEARGGDDGNGDEDQLEYVKAEIGKKLKSSMKAIAVEQLRIT